jgi:hypothetical protein
MNKYFALLVSSLLVALAGGCGEEEAPEDVIGGWQWPPNLNVCFVDSEGGDLLAGIPTIKLETARVKYDGDFLSNNTFRIKLFVNDEEILSLGMPVGLFHKGESGLPYDAITFTLWDLLTPINNQSNSTIYIVKGEVVCPYVFGNDEVHTLQGELSRQHPGGSYWYRICWFDGVETLPAYYHDPGDVRKDNSFVARIDR